MPNNSRPIIQIVGPFASNYSLAKVNRELALALDKYIPDYETRLWAEESQVDRMPGKKDFVDYPVLERLYRKEESNAKFEIYNNFPKSFPKKLGLDMLKAPVRTAYLAWEESVFPHNLAMEVNEHLHGLMVTSSHVQRLMRKSGVTIPIANVGEGLNQTVTYPERYRLKTKKNFKFLHISSGIPRKALDILIEAYVEEFGGDEDVCLVIKTYHNEENQIPQLMSRYATKSGPEIEVIYDLDLTDGHIADLYRQSNAVVIPSRAEGFGLPIAEAMLNRRPVVTTGYGGQMDFVEDSTAFLLDFKMGKADSQLNIKGSTWAEPSLQELRKYLRYLFENISKEEVSQKVERAYKTATSLTWESTATKVMEFLEYLAKIKDLKNTKLAVISTFNSVCGVAEYSRDLYENIEGAFQEVKYFANSDAEIVFKDPKNVERTWEYSEWSFENTIKAINDFGPENVHIQYNASFYSIDSLIKLISQVKQSSRKLYLTMHSLPEVAYEEYKGVLSGVDLIFVHSEKDFVKLSRAGYPNILKFTHGVKEFPERGQERLREKLDLKGMPVIASHGLIHEHKGLLEILQAMELLSKDFPDIKFLSVNAVNKENSTSVSTFSQMEQFIDKAGLRDKVVLIRDFLEKSEVVTLLQTADILLLPYGELNEGASGAVRTCLSALRPVIITKSAIFEDLGSEVGYKIEDNRPENIRKAVKELYQSKDKYYNQHLKTKKFVLKYSWENQSREYLLLLSR